ncbi:hypothetical protein HC031_21565 [Planosporangium thailandense]|uniref:Uncharacterized protein n=1 Tax=Planosporangium thailandense TaxID=765197 RepID=A0ABX0Y1P8_9ACTN|nr:hypothetical protein [Planosporangium thailandense]NJC72284.1 hypothetical protein [Planosporangium thailandense]
MKAVSPERYGRIELGKHLVDKSLLDRDDLRCGKVDDLVLDLSDADPGRPPELVALVTGPLAYARTLGRVGTALARGIYRLLGIRDPHPVEVPWSRVRQVDVMVRLDLSRAECDVNAVSDTVRDRLFAHLPGA